MNILVIDYLGEKGHRKFNRIHFEAIESLGNEVFYVGREGQFPGLLKDNNNLIIPEFFYKKRIMSSFLSRIAMVRCLLWIKKRVTFKYDSIIIPTYDAFSVGVIPSDKPVIIINHNNVGQLNNIIKKTVTKWVTSKMIHVVLNRDMENRLKDILPNAKIFFIPHGYYPIEKTLKPSFIKGDQKFIICPINRNYNPSYTSSLFSSPELDKFLQDNGIEMYVKKGIVDNPSKRIHIIDNNLSIEEYEYLINNSISVILPYDEHFRYRCSGIFFECIAANKPILLSDIEAFNEYHNISGIFYFSNLHSLLNSVEESLNSIPQRNNESFQPKPFWANLLNNLL